MSIKEYQAYLEYCYRLIASASRIEFSWSEIFSGLAQQRLTTFNRSVWYPGKVYEPSIYEIYDSTDQPLYVGQSKRIIGRLKDHIGCGDFCVGGKCVTPVGRYIKANSPQSHDWQISVLDLPSHLEEPTIWQLNPYYNTESKPNQPSAVPIPAPAILP